MGSKVDSKVDEKRVPPGIRLLGTNESRSIPRELCVKISVACGKLVRFPKVRFPVQLLFYPNISMAIGRL